MSRVPDASTQEKRSFFQKQDPWGQGVAIWVLVLILFVAPLAGSSLRHVRLDNNVENWLPENDPSAQEYLWCRAHFPEDEKVILTWEGSAADDMRLPVLAGMLSGQVDEDGIRRGGLPYVDSVMHAGDLLSKLVEFGVEEDEAIRRISGTFIGTGHLKVRLTEAGRDQKEKTIKLIQERIQSQFGLELTIHEPVSPWMPAELDEDAFQKLYSRYRSALETETELTPSEFGQHDFQVSWTGIGSNQKLKQAVIDSINHVASFATSDEPDGRQLVESCYEKTGTPIAVVVTLSEAGGAEKSKAIAAIREAAIASFIPDDGLIVGGRVVAAAELNNGVIRAAWNPNATSILGKSVIGFSGLVGILFAIFSLKCLRLGGLVIFVSYYSAFLGVSLIPLSGGSMNMVLVVLPTLLMVLALSGAIHIANYWKHAVWENPKTAVAEATKMARQPCLMAAFTTSLGLISLINSDLAPVREFGIYAALGCMISVAMVLYGLPALLQMVPLRRSAPEEVKSKRWSTYSDVICRHWLSIGASTIVLAIACSIGLRHFDVETKVIRYFPESSPVVQDYQTIEDNLAGISPVEILVRFDKQSQSDLRFLERVELVREIEEEIRNHPEVSGAISMSSFLPQRTSPGENAAMREKIFYNRRSNETEKRIKEEHAAESSAFIVMNRLPEVNGDELWRINAQAAVLSDADYTTLTQQLSDRVGKITRYHAGVDHTVTGTVPLFLRTQLAVLDSLVWSSVAAFVLIASVMIWVLKDPLAGIGSMIPNVLPVISIFGLVSWFGQKIDIGTMVTASVAMGIAVDGTLHLLTWFRNGLRKGMPRQASVKQALMHCGPAMWQTSAAVGIGLLVLFPADLLLISRFGWLMALLIGAAFIGDMVLLPCMLVGPLGRLIERRIRLNGEIEVADESEEPNGATVVPSPHISLHTTKRRKSQRARELRNPEN
ncbi:efflux RND transporter permease subunit [Thalassoglobus sp.]|uniref:efflux RND transporter permease subunit n=1 Tax=Thalassoglobus sp. TaxID=2795869 RepID=UPI003AA7F749